MNDQILSMSLSSFLFIFLLSCSESSEVRTLPPSPYPCLQWGYPAAFLVSVLTLQWLFSFIKWTFRQCKFYCIAAFLGPTASICRRPGANLSVSMLRLQMAECLVRITGHMRCVYSLIKRCPGIGCPEVLPPLCWRWRSSQRWRRSSLESSDGCNCAKDNNSHQQTGGSGLSLGVRFRFVLFCFLARRRFYCSNPSNKGIFASHWPGLGHMAKKISLLLSNAKRKEDKEDKAGHGSCVGKQV